MVQIHLDFETRSVADIRQVGSFRYSEDITTDILCLAYAINDAPPILWLPSQKTPPNELLHRTMLFGATVHAWNAEFEMNIWENICVKRWGWPEVPLEKWRDTMAQSAAMSLPLALKDACEVLETSQKDFHGAKLIQKLCRPWRGQFREYDDFPDDFHDLYEYCKQDVVAEREAGKKLLPLTPSEMDIWRHCITMNRRGLPIDMAEVNAVVYQVDKTKDRLNATLPFLTKGEVTSATQNARLLKWIRKKGGINIDSIDKAHVTKLLESKNTPEDVKHVLRIRQQVGKSSTAKLVKAQAQVCKDQTIKNNYVYYGANTGRYAGRGFQVQNMPARGVKIENPGEVITDFMTMDYPVLNLTYDIMAVASSLIRPLLKAPHGKKFIVGDFKSIEAVVTPWLALETVLVEAIRGGLDQYVEIASRMFNVPYDKVTDNMRSVGKVCVLACGFAGGKGALLNMATNYNMDLREDTAQKYVEMFRAARPSLVSCWNEFQKAAVAALDLKADVVPVGNAKSTTFAKEGGNLVMRLPSGRKIYYPNAFMHYGMTPWGANKLQPHYFTKNSVTHKWEARTMTGGNFFQNAVQGIARDLLTTAQLRLEKAGYPICLSTHDECGGVYPDDPMYNLENFLKVMTENPRWAADMPLEADGWEGMRYRK